MLARPELAQEARLSKRKMAGFSFRGLNSNYFGLFSPHKVPVTHAASVSMRK